MAGDSFIYPQPKARSWPVAVAVSVLATLAATVLRLSLTPLIGNYSLPVTLFFPAVLVSAWYGGLLAGTVCILLSTIAAVRRRSELDRSHLQLDLPLRI